MKKKLEDGYWSNPYPIKLVNDLDQSLDTKYNPYFYIYLSLPALMEVYTVPEAS